MVGEVLGELPSIWSLVKIAKRLSGEDVVSPVFCLGHDGMKILTILRFRLFSIFGLFLLFAIGVAAWHFAHRLRIVIVNLSGHKVSGLVTVQDPVRRITETPRWVLPGESFQMTFNSVGAHFNFHGIFVTSDGQYVKSSGLTFSGLPTNFRFDITLKDEMFMDDVEGKLFRGLNPDSTGRLQRSPE